MNGHEPPLEFEALPGEFTVTPEMARILLLLARRHLEWEKQQDASGQEKKDVA